jgi:hypothetical protein
LQDENDILFRPDSETKNIPKGSYDCGATESFAFSSRRWRDEKGKISASVFSVSFRVSRVKIL